MWEDIEKKGARFQELKSFLESPDGPGNPQYAAWLREYGRLGKFGELWDKYVKARKQVSESELLLKDPASDADIKALADEELDAGKADMDAARTALIDMQLNEDDDSSRN